jgi:hypothetical protein
MMTPSGLSIGTILKTKLFLRYLAPSLSLIKYSRVPCMMNEAFDSPGWTLDVNIMALRTAISSGLEVKLVMITISQSFPAIVLHSMVFLILSLDSGVQIFPRYSQESL